MRTLRGKLTYANVISTLCLFMLLGGGAYAAKTQLAKNSVGTKQIKNNAITGKKIKNGTIDAGELTPATVTALKGAKGDTGAVGPEGPIGLSNSGAFATVVPEIPPIFLGSHPGFEGVHRPEGSSGVFCLTPSAGISIEHPLAAPDWADSAGVANFIEPLAGGTVNACEEGQLEVHTTKLEQEVEGEETRLVAVPTNFAAFTVFVPQEQE
jgi:hypothetical protein